MWWAVLTAVAVSILQVLAEFEPAAITDLKTWGIAVGAGAVRAAAVAALAVFGKARLAR